jgi:hypothetical protein
MKGGWHLLCCSAPSASLARDSAADVGRRKLQKIHVNKAKYGCDAIAHLLLLLTVDSMCRHS